VKTVGVSKTSNSKLRTEEKNNSRREGPTRADLTGIKLKAVIEESVEVFFLVPGEGSPDCWEPIKNWVPVWRGVGERRNMSNGGGKIVYS